MIVSHITTIIIINYHILLIALSYVIQFRSMAAFLLSASQSDLDTLVASGYLTIHSHG
jgi:hypothetical protein